MKKNKPIIKNTRKVNIVVRRPLPVAPKKRRNTA